MGTEWGVGMVVFSSLGKDHWEDTQRDWEQRPCCASLFGGMGLGERARSAV